MSKLSFLFIFLFSFSASATEMVGAISGGLGGTGRAAVESNESLFLNPASIALFNKFYTGVSYQSGFTTPGVSRNTYSVSMTDGTKGILLPGSFSYRRHKISDSGVHINEDEFKAGVGFRMTPRLSFGLAGSYLKANLPADREIDQGNFDIGALIGILPNWGLGITGENLLRGDDTTPLSLRRNSRVGVGTQYVFDKAVTFRYEALMPLYIENSRLFGHRMGASFMMKNYVYINGGYSVDDSLGQNWTSVGFTWKGPRLKMAYSFQNESRADLGQRHFVDLWVDL